MNVRLGDFKHLAVAGFRDVEIRDVNEFFQAVKCKTGNVCVQFFDASVVAGLEHLRFAALNALNAFKSKVNISSSLAIETLLYASAQRQIKEAIRLIGIKQETSRVVVLALTENLRQASTTLDILSNLLNGRRDDSVIDLTKGKMAGLKKLFGISTVELEAKTKRKGAQKQALTDLVIEHMALLVTQH